MFDFLFKPSVKFAAGRRPSGQRPVDEAWFDETFEGSKQSLVILVRDRLKSRLETWAANGEWDVELNKEIKDLQALIAEIPTWQKPQSRSVGGHIFFIETQTP